MKIRKTSNWIHGNPAKSSETGMFEKERLFLAWDRLVDGCWWFMFKWRMGEDGSREESVSCQNLHNGKWFMYLCHPPPPPCNPLHLPSPLPLPPFTIYKLNQEELRWQSGNSLVCIVYHKSSRTNTIFLWTHTLNLIRPHEPHKPLWTSWTSWILWTSTRKFLYP